MSSTVLFSSAAYESMALKGGLSFSRQANNLHSVTTTKNFTVFFSATGFQAPSTAQQGKRVATAKGTPFGRGQNDDYVTSAQKIAERPAAQSTSVPYAAQVPRASNCGASILVFQSADSFGENWDLALKEADYPPHYDLDLFEHAEDYKELDEPIFEAFLYPGPPMHFPSNPHERVFLRACFKMKKTGKYLPMTFLVDTGTPQDVHVCRKARTLLKKGVRVNYPPEYGAGPEIIDIYGRQAMLGDTPGPHQPANILGLNMIVRMGMRLYENADGSKGVTFDKPLPYF